MALLEADVALPVVREFINRVKEKAVGHEVNKSLTPGQEFVKIVRNELVAAMGEEPDPESGCATACGRADGRPARCR